MITQCRNNGLSDPDFVEKRSEFRTIIYREIYTENMLKQFGLNEREK